MANAKRKNKEIDRSWHFSNGWRYMKKGAWEVNFFSFSVEFCDTLGEVMFRGCLLNFWYDFSIKVCKPVPYNPTFLRRHRLINGYMREDYLKLLDKYAKFGEKKYKLDGNTVIAFSKRPLTKAAGWEKVCVQWTIEEGK